MWARWPERRPIPSSSSAAALIPTFVLAAAVWLFHDLVGAGLWIPIQSAIIQDECRDETRGLDLSKTLAFAALGGSIGPVLAGHLTSISISAPYFVSGLLVASSAAVLTALRLRPRQQGNLADSPAAGQAPAAG